MLKRIIPILLVENQELIKTVRFSSPTYIGDVLNSIKIYNEFNVDELCVLDKSAMINGINYNMIEAFTNESFSPLSYGGGIYQLSQIEKILRMGVEKIVIGSEGVNLEFLRSAITNFGSSTITICVDYKIIKGEKFVFLNNGKRNSNITISHYINKLSSIGIGEIIIQSIDNDGTFNGYDLQTLKEITNEFQNPVVIAGGCGELMDIKKAFDLSASGAAAGSLFVYYSKAKGILINYPSLEEFNEYEIIR